MRYDENNLVWIDGFKKSKDDIIAKYMDCINNGYDLTMDDIQNYLCCSYTYVNINLIDKVKHIRINDAARAMVIQDENNIFKIEEDKKKLIYKRILFERNDFKRYLKDNIIVEMPYKTIPLDNFNGIKDIYLKYFKNKTSFKEFLQKNAEDLFKDGGNSFASSFPYFSLPERLYSMKQIKPVLKMKYDIQVYRRIEENGVKKYHLHDLVRYDLKDFEREYIKINYNSYIKYVKRDGEREEEEVIEYIKNSIKSENLNI